MDGGFADKLSGILFRKVESCAAGLLSAARLMDIKFTLAAGLALGNPASAVAAGILGTVSLSMGTMAFFSPYKEVSGDVSDTLVVDTPLAMDEVVFFVVVVVVVVMVTGFTGGRSIRMSTNEDDRGCGSKHDARVDSA